MPANNCEHCRVCNVVLIALSSSYLLIGIFITAAVLSGIEHEAEDFAECKECTHLALVLEQAPGQRGRCDQVQQGQHPCCQLCQDGCGGFKSESGAYGASKIAPACMDSQHTLTVAGESMGVCLRARSHYCFAPAVAHPLYN
jgi:hypothetical protein